MVAVHLAQLLAVSGIARLQIAAVAGLAATEVQVG